MLPWVVCVKLSYVELGHLITNNKHLANYVETTNGTWRHLGDDIILDATNTTLVGGVVSVGLGCDGPHTLGNVRVI